MYSSASFRLFHLLIPIPSAKFQSHVDVPFHQGYHVTYRKGFCTCLLPSLFVLLSLPQPFVRSVAPELGLRRNVVRPVSQVRPPAPLRDASLTVISSLREPGKYSRKPVFRVYEAEIPSLPSCNISFPGKQRDENMCAETNCCDERPKAGRPPRLQRCNATAI